ncbi:hypothetical protein XCR1_2870004 [Xenorhabdus cabanillasii JM26]|uniref:Uncharacterized protein n=1 Tax=Xenorhabdus cabanillasii JM26 TaxID=1427517 RepID=W1J641_9GAMM|nr:hypothetical protein XCR1_2870004 [Xenorhabdus cabanillasii JM26]
MHRYGESISSSLAESTINEVIAKRMVKKQQMERGQQSSHYLSAPDSNSGTQS